MAIPQLYLLVGCALWLASVWYWKRSAAKPVPPGPGTRRANEEPWRAYSRWASELGPLVTINPVGRPVVVINTVKAAFDLLEKRAHFACRPRWPMAELLGRQNNVGFQYYGERLKKCRRVLHGALSQTAVSTTWGQFIDEQSVKLLRKVGLAPESFYSDVIETVEEMIVLFTYGRPPQPEYRELAKAVMHDTGVALQPGRWMVNLIPILMYVPAWVPGAGFKKWAREAKDAFVQLTRTPFLQVKAEMEQGKAEQSFVRDALRTAAEEDEGVVMSAAGSLYSAGTDTISGAILTFFLLIMRHPDVQERAYEEIVSVVGTDRLPELADRPSLRYLDCVIQEAFRFNPPIPLVTHSNSKEDEYEGCRIPKKTWLMGNIWAMLHNEDEYKDSESFLPERFLPREGYEPARDPRTLIYGFGRRICPGAHFANNYIYFVISRAIACYEICPEEKEGSPEYPPLEFVTGLVPTPKPFRCNLKPRPHAHELLKMGQVPLVR